MTVTVEGEHLDPGGEPMTGTVTVSLPEPFDDPEADTTYAGSATVALTSGAWSMTLPSTEVLVEFDLTMPSGGGRFRRALTADLTGQTGTVQWADLEAT